MNTKSVWFERLYAGHVNKWFEMYSSSQGANYYAIHSLLYLRTIQEKYIKMYERLVKRILTSNKNVLKGILTNIAPATFKISENTT